MTALTYKATSSYGSVSVDIRTPPLTGSPKQVDWALDLRARVIDQSLRVLIGSPRQIEAVAADLPELLRAMAVVVEQTREASVWIERHYHHRFADTWVLREAAQALYAQRQAKQVAL